jgi:FKBP-type peptidyl-prolyl cis-trans isomerase FkpA
MLLTLLAGAALAQNPGSRPISGGENPGPSNPQTPRPATKTAAPKRTPVKPQVTAPPALMTDDQKTIYALGLSVYGSLAQFDLSPEEVEIVRRAIADAAAKKPALELSAWGPKIQPLAQTRAARAAEQQKAESAAYLATAAAAPGAIKTDSGLIYREITPGTGPSPKGTDTVKVNYRGTLVDGTEFDSSYKRNEPAQFPLNGVIQCWTEGVQRMKVGGKSVLVCPSDLAYGDRGRPSIPGGATLIFEIELLEIVGASQQGSHRSGLPASQIGSSSAEFGTILADRRKKTCDLGSQTL